MGHLLVRLLSGVGGAMFAVIYQLFQGRKQLLVGLSKLGGLPMIHAKNPKAAIAQCNQAFSGIGPRQVSGRCLATKLNDGKYGWSYAPERDMTGERRWPN